MQAQQLVHLHTLVQRAWLNIAALMSCSAGVYIHSCHSYPGVKPHECGFEQHCSCRYTKFVTSTVGSIEAVVPPTPNLTRYKRELAVKAEEASGRNSPKTAKYASHVRICTLNITYFVTYHICHYPLSPSPPTLLPHPLRPFNSAQNVS